MPSCSCAFEHPKMTDNLAGRAAPARALSWSGSYGAVTTERSAEAAAQVRRSPPLARAEVLREAREGLAAISQRNRGSSPCRDGVRPARPMGKAWVQKERRAAGACRLASAAPLTAPA